MSARLLGIDIGTTGVRCALFDTRGNLVADASTAHTVESPTPGWAETEADVFWRRTRVALTELGEQARLDEVAAIAVVGQAPTAILVDGNGATVRPSVLWLDTRADAEAKALGTQAYYLGPKLQWLAKHEPEAIAKARHVLQSHAFVAMKLCGEVATDPSTAALCLPLFDLARREWLQDACVRLGLDPKVLPPIRRSTDVLGEVTREAAKETGLQAGTPVIVGGGDFAAATLGAGVVDEGEACLMLGTAGNLLVPRKTPGTDARLINAHHVGADVWLSLGGTLSGGAQEWMRYAITRGTSSEDDTAVRGALPSFEQLDKDASSVAPGANGLLFLPYLQGERTPIWDVEARGAYIGLGLNHSRGHLWRALLEGIALSFVDCQQVLESDGVRFGEVIAANGGGKSALFRQILCDALGVPLAYTPKGGGTVAGAALIAALGAGVLGSAAEAKKWRGESVRHEPDMAATERYRALLGTRREAYAGLKGVFGQLAAQR